MGRRPSGEVSDGEGSALAIDQIGPAYAHVKTVSEHIEEVIHISENLDDLEALGNVSAVTLANAQAAAASQAAAAGSATAAAASEANVAANAATATAKAAEATTRAADALTYLNLTIGHKDAAAASASAASTSEGNALSYKNLAEGFKNNASASAIAAALSAADALAHRNAAAASATAAANSATAAAGSATTAQGHAVAAGDHRSAADTAATNAGAAATAADADRIAAETAKTAAQAAQAAAEAARDEASDIVGGDFATNTALAALDAATAKKAGGNSFTGNQLFTGQMDVRGFYYLRAPNDAAAAARWAVQHFYDGDNVWRQSVWAGNPDNTYEIDSPITKICDENSAPYMTLQASGISLTKRMSLAQGNVANAPAIEVTNCGDGTTGVKVAFAGGGHTYFGGTSGVGGGNMATTYSENRGQRFWANGNAFDAATTGFLFSNAKAIGAHAITVQHDIASATGDFVRALDSTGAVKARIKADGGAVFTNVEVANVAYGAGWNGSLLAPTCDAIYDEIEALKGLVVGAMVYKGVWNASTNSPAIPAAAAGNKGWFYKVSASGSTSIDGITDWVIGDWIVSNGTSWDKIDNSELVSSVNGQSGAVVLNTSHIAESGNLYYTDVRVRAAPLTGFTTSTPGSLDASMTVLQAFNRIQANFDSHYSSLAGKMTTGFYGSSGQDLNALTTPGAFRIQDGSVNAPTDNAWGNVLVVKGSAGDTLGQILMTYTGGFSWRGASGIGGTPSWSAWDSMSNYGKYAAINAHWTGIQRFTSGNALGAAVANGQFYSNAAGDGSFCSWHRDGNAIVYAGLDTDNVFKIGGGTWSSAKLSLSPTTLTFAGSTMWINTDKLVVQHDGSNGFVRAQTGALLLGSAGNNVIAIQGDRNVIVSGQTFALYTAAGVGGSDGHVKLDAGNAANTGYISFFTGGGTRVGYIGYADASNINMTAEAGRNWLFTGNTYFNNNIYMYSTGANPIINMRRDGANTITIQADTSYLYLTAPGVYHRAAGHFWQNEAGSVAYMNIGLDSGTPRLTVNGNFTCKDIIASRGDGTGAIYFGGGSEYLYWDAANFNLTDDLIVSGNITTTSDRRLKKHIAYKVNFGLAEVCALKPATYRWKGENESEKEIGLIAQDVEEIFPEFVTTGKDGMKSVDYQRLSVACIAAIKELAARVEALEAK